MTKRRFGLGLTFLLVSCGSVTAFATSSPYKRLCEHAFFRGELAPEPDFRTETLKFLKLHFPEFGHIVERFRSRSDEERNDPEIRRTAFKKMRLMTEEMRRRGVRFGTPSVKFQLPSNANASDTKSPTLTARIIEGPGGGHLETLKAAIPAGPYPIRFAFAPALPLLDDIQALSLNGDNAIALPITDLMRPDLGIAEIHEITHQLSHRALLSEIHEHSLEHLTGRAFFENERLVLQGSSGTLFLVKIVGIDQDLNVRITGRVLASLSGVQGTSTLSRHTLIKMIERTAALSWSPPTHHQERISPHVAFELNLTERYSSLDSITDRHPIVQSYFAKNHHTHSDETLAYLAEALGHYRHWKTTQNPESLGLARHSLTGAIAMANTFVAFLTHFYSRLDKDTKIDAADSLLPRVWIRTEADPEASLLLKVPPAAVQDDQFLDHAWIRARIQSAIGEMTLLSRLMSELFWSEFSDTNP